LPGGREVAAEMIDGRLCFKAAVIGAHSVYRIET